MDQPIEPGRGVAIKRNTILKATALARLRDSWLGRRLSWRQIAGAARRGALLAALRDALMGRRTAAANDPAALRLVLVGHDGKPHGAQLLLLNVAHRLVSHDGVEVRVLLGDPGPLEAAYGALGPTRVIPGSFGDMAAWEAAARALRADGVTAVLCNTLVSAKAIPALRAAGLRVVTLVHELPALIQAYGLADAASRTARESDVVLFASRYGRDRFVELAGPIRHRCVIRPQGLYLAPPPRADWPGMRAKLRQDLGLKPHQTMVLSAGVGDLRKGIDLWPILVRQVALSCPEAVFVWAGYIEPALAGQLQRDIAQSGRAAQMRLIGQTADMTPLYVAADLFLLPSREDPYPSVVLEAMSCGRPVVAFEGAGGLNDLLRNTGNQPVSHLDTTAMASRIVELLRDPALRDRLGRAGQERIAEDHRFSDYAAELRRLVEDAPRTLSVVVPTSIHAQSWRERIATILAQTFPIHEIILLDASTDGSAAVMAEIEQASMGRVHVVYTAEDPGGAIRQWIRGVELAQGELVWIAEADNLSDPDFLAATVSAFDDHDVVLSYNQSRAIDGDGSFLDEDHADYVADVDNARGTKDYTRPGVVEIAEALSVTNTIPAVSAAVFRRKALAQVLSRQRDELLGLRHAADWCCYLHLLTHGAMAFKARPLNSHRRTASRLTVSTDDRRHLDEIGQMQRLAADLVPADKLEAARHWRHAVEASSTP